MSPPLQKPAPAFKGTAVVDGQFKDISLEDYKGMSVFVHTKISKNSTIYRVLFKISEFVSIYFRRYLTGLC